MKRTDTDALPRSIVAAKEYLPGARVAVIAVPGAYAAREARTAVERGIHVIIPASDVSVDDEVALKNLASKHFALVMGTGCRAVILDGVSLGSANRVRMGSVALVSTTGGALQEVSTLVHNYGAGISHGIGVGVRDLSDAVGARSMLAALEMLTHDEKTEVIVLLARSPSPSMAARVLDAAVATGRKVVAGLLGYTAPTRHPGVHAAATLEDAARVAATLSGVGRESEYPTLRVTIPRFNREQRWLRAIYSSTTLAYEAMVMLEGSVRVHTNLAFVEGSATTTQLTAASHVVVDCGEAPWMPARHAGNDLEGKREAIRAIANDPTASVLLLDVLLGYGAHHDPASVLAPAIREAREAAIARGGTLIVVASVTGTDDDPQSRPAQVQSLVAAGCEVCSSNAAAVRRARAIVTGEWP
jgi:FdrA protein